MYQGESHAEVFYELYVPIIKQYCLTKIEMVGKFTFTFNLGNWAEEELVIEDFSNNEGIEVEAVYDFLETIVGLEDASEYEYKDDIFQAFYMGLDSALEEKGHVDS